MEMARISEWIDIQAPKEELFGLITSLERRMQLSPLWGLTKVTERCGDYPQVGSGYVARVVEGVSQEYETVVTEYQPPTKFSYCIDVDMLTTVTWRLQDTANGIRLTYTEEYIPPEQDQEAFAEQVRKVIHDWLNNIKRYSELREGWLNKTVRWLLDRYFLRLRQDQRKVILMLLVLQISGTIAFIAAAVGMGVASLFFK
jgi:hypothetical protein